MPKRKWNRLHDDGSIADERHHRSRQLREQREARATIDENLAERREQPAPPPTPDPDDEPPRA